MISTSYKVDNCGLFPIRVCYNHCSFKEQNNSLCYAMRVILKWRHILKLLSSSFVFERLGLLIPDMKGGLCPKKEFWMIFTSSSLKCFKICLKKLFKLLQQTMHEYFSLFEKLKSDCHIRFFQGFTATYYISEATDQLRFHN